ncbi:DNA glycosylase [Crepidotus variabilis]|uniref:DNA-(apurinic or apyrimidinic site) lyase n=1 Tax=Crepidotus variabilis TaxID=179855 RepID=A0A9P6EDF5_9AGAR|nr:DNA glycosylase [Crepidotus variabilis]
MASATFKSLPVPIAQLSLAAVLKCGQSFRWSILTPDDLVTGTTFDSVEYRFCLKDRVVCLRQSSDTLYYRSAFPDPLPSSDILLQRDNETLLWLRDYFQLKLDLVVLYKQWAAKDKVFASFQSRFEGIRILRQDPWENLISFICSSNNNISRISKMVQNLCIHYSPPLLSLSHPFKPSEMMEYHPFPPPSALATPAVGLHLRSLGFGYRANFIQRTAEMLVDTHGSTLGAESRESSELWLQKLRLSTTSEAREELLKFVGVGRKVADCVLLMSLDKAEVVPVDTHVYQIAVKHYGLKSSKGKANMTPKLYDELSSKFFKIWGEHAGWAHTILFTADLKSFANYGLPNPSSSSSAMNSPSPTKKRKAVALLDTNGEIPTPESLTPVSSQMCKVEAKLELVDVALSNTLHAFPKTGELNMVERVKRRKRGMRS